jgi:hypothetical protein
MLKRTIFFGLFALGLLLQSCYYDNEVYLYGAGGGSACDTTTVTYSGTIVPILNNNGCNTCHTVTSGNGIVTTDYANLKLLATNGKLVNSVNGTGTPLMPLGGQKMPSCTLAKISKWVRDGALNN